MSNKRGKPVSQNPSWDMGIDSDMWRSDLEWGQNLDMSMPLQWNVPWIAQEDNSENESKDEPRMNIGAGLQDDAESYLEDMQ